MMNATKIEQRLSAIEQDLARLKKQGRPKAKQRPIQALEAIHGSFENDDAFKDAVQLGRRWRESQQPKFRKPRAKR